MCLFARPYVRSINKFNLNLFFGRAALASTMDALDKEADGKGGKGATSVEMLGGSEEGKRLLESLEGRRTTITGVFDHTKEVLVGEEGASG